MMKRCGIVGALTLWIGASGCTGMARRADGLAAAGPRGWAEAPASQRTVLLPPERQETAVAAPGAVGLSKYFPGLRRNSTEAPKVAATARPSLFTIARRPRAHQVYTTDARSGLNAGRDDAAALPVALQVPGERATDDAVTPTAAEAPSVAAPEARAEERDSATPAEGSPLFPPAGGVALTAVADGAKPPPASEPEAPIVAGRMPTLPAIDPLGSSRSAPDEPKAEVARTSAVEGSPIPAAEPEPRPAAEAAKLDRPAADPRERPRMDPASSTPGESIPGEKSDDGAVQAGPASAPAPGVPEPMIRTSFLHRMASTVRPAKHVHAPTVLASPQALPSPQARPTPQAKPMPQVLPTSQVQPSGQGAVVGESCEASHQAKSCHKCCLKQLIRKVFVPSSRAKAAPAH